MARTRVKICCIASVSEAQLAIRYGADAIGLVGRMPSGPGPIEDAMIHEIAAHIPPSVSSFLLTSETTFEGIALHYSRVWTNAVQLVDSTTVTVRRSLKKEFPWIKIVQVVHVQGKESIEDAVEFAAGSDMLLLDSGRPSEDIKILGGTGQMHDWRISAEIVRKASLPVFLAGGLRASNVRSAIKAVRPFGVDLCSGVRSDNVLDTRKLSDFMSAIYPELV